MGSTKPAFLSLQVNGQEVLSSRSSLIAELIRHNMVSFVFTDSRKGADNFKLDLDGLPYDIADTLEVEEDTEVTLVFGAEDWEIRREMIIDEVNNSHGTNKSGKKGRRHKAKPALTSDYGETVKLSLRGVDHGTQMTKRSGKVWKNKTDSEIATDIAKLHGFGTDGVIPTTIRRSFYAQANRTYMEMLQDLASDNGYYAKVRDKKLYFAPIGHDGAAVLTLHRADGQSPVLEAFSVSSKRSAVSSGAKVDVKGVDKGTGANATGSKTDAEAEAALKLTYKGNGNVSKQAPDPTFMPGESYQAYNNTVTDIASYASTISVPLLPGLNLGKVVESAANAVSTMMAGAARLDAESGTVEHAAHGNAALAAKRAEAVSDRILWKSVKAKLSTRNVMILSTQTVAVVGAIAKKHIGNYYADEVTYTLEGLSWAVEAEVSRKPFNTKGTKKTTGIESETLGQSLDTTGMSQAEIARLQGLGKGHKVIVYDNAGFQQTGLEVEPNSSGGSGGMSVPL